MDAENQRLLAKYGTHRNGHSIFAPSAASMWLHCSGSLLANAVAVDDAGEDAAYGTVAHEMAQRWLTEGRQPTDMLNRTFEVVNGARTFHITADVQMAAFVEQYVDWCRELPGDHYYERRVDLSDYTPIPGQGGTADAAACEPGLLTITDLKMGLGVKVFVENNDQARMYALGFFAEWDFIYSFKRIVIRICQPRLDYFGVWEISRDELIAFGEFVKERAGLAWKENAPRTPSPKSCRFCKAKLTCPAISMQLDDLIDEAFDVPVDYEAQPMISHEYETLAGGVPIPEVTSTIALSTDMLVFRLRYRKLFESWFKAIYDELMRRAQDGERVRGFKLTNGRRAFSWSDEEAATELLESHGLDETDFAPRKLVSVAEVKKLLRAIKMKPKEIDAILSDVVHIGYSAPSLVASADDEREDIQDAVDDLFTVDDDDL